MGVKLEIRAKELGLMVKNRKPIEKKSPPKSMFKGGSSVSKLSAFVSSQVKSIKKNPLASMLSPKASPAKPD